MAANITISIISTLGQAVLIAFSLRWIAFARKAWRKRFCDQRRAP